jgi:hypothetical protein
MIKKTLLFIICAFVMISSVQAALTDNLMLYYKSDDDGTYPDELENYDGTITGATYTSSGKINGGYYFDGINDGVTTTFQPTGITDFSINLWVKSDDWSQGTTNIQLLNSYITGSTSSWFAIKQDESRIYFQFDTGSVAKSVYYSTDAYTDATDWVMVTAIRDTTTEELRLYFDGVEVKTESITGNTGSVNMNNDLNIGKHGQDEKDYYSGILDEIGIWNKVLNTTEITNLLYNSGDGFSYPFTVETVNNPPIINISDAYTNNYNTSNNNVSFNYTPYDEDIDELTCSLYINNTLNATDSSISENNVNYFNVTLINNIYSWIIGCFDGENYTNTTSRNLIVYNPPPIINKTPFYVNKGFIRIMRT